LGVKLISNDGGEDAAADGKDAEADEAQQDGDKEPQPAEAARVE